MNAMHFPQEIFLSIAIEFFLFWKKMSLLFLNQLTRSKRGITFIYKFFVFFFFCDRRDSLNDFNLEMTGCVCVWGQKPEGQLDPQ